MDVAFQLHSGKCIDWDSAKTSFIEGLVSGLLLGGAVTDFLVGMAVDIGMRGETPANAFGNQMLGLGLDKFLRGFGKGARGADNAPAKHTTDIADKASDFASFIEMANANTSMNMFDVRGDFEITESLPTTIGKITIMGDEAQLTTLRETGMFTVGEGGLLSFEI